jgi:hypothetical protein
MPRVLQLKNILTEDHLAVRISENWIEWGNLKSKKIDEWRELKKYIYATDTTQTTNSKLPWSNKTVTPKLTQIRDNLEANYMATMFPKRRWLKWIADVEEDQKKEKASAIRNYMGHVVDQPEFQMEVAKLVLDYIDFGNVFAMPDWVDRRVEQENKTQTGYVGPVLRRINPLDINFNSSAPTFVETPKIVRSLVGLGEAKKTILKLSATDEDRVRAEELWAYMYGLRNDARGWRAAPVAEPYYDVDGYESFRDYLLGDFVELLTFYGDLYDSSNDTFYENYVITVVDRHKICYMKPHESWFGVSPLYHSGWRIRQDNLWAMGPLDNLVGMQYRIDHIENMKADMMDLTAMPPLKIKGYVEDFNWQPLEKIAVGDDGDVEPLIVDPRIMQYNTELAYLESKMEEMAGAPREAMGFRTPGEKTMYEVQRLENAAGRIFQKKITQFEREVLEPSLNAMLELARRKMQDTVVRYVDDDLNISLFETLTPEDITGQGRIVPIAARHFAEKAERFQNLNMFLTQGIGANPIVQQHMSGIKLAKLFEDMLEIEEYKIVEPYVALAEQADAQRQANVHQEEVMMEMTTPTGVTPEDADVI